MSGWDETVKIGKNVRTGGGAARETVVRSQSALNAAKRSGAAITTEKKFATGNQVRLPFQPQQPSRSPDKQLTAPAPNRPAAAKASA